MLIVNPIAGVEMSCAAMRGLGGQPGQVVVKSRGSMTIVKAPDIDWIEAMGDYACLHSGGRAYLLRERLHILEEEFAVDRIIRIHRSTLVNLDRVTRLDARPFGDYTVTLEDGTRLAMSRTHRTEVMARLTNTSHDR